MTPPFRITDAEVVAMRERYAADSGLGHQALADEYGVTTTTISRICRGDVRREAGGPFTFGRKRLMPFVLTDSDVSFSLHAAAAYLGVRQASVRMYLHRGRLERDGAGLVTFDSLERYRLERQRIGLPPKPRPPPVQCERCGLLDHADGLCSICRAEMRTGKFVLYYLGFDNSGEVV